MASVVTGITRAARELDLRPVLDEMPDPETLSPVLRRREVDGAIVFVASGLALNKLVNLHQHLPVVWVMGGEGGPFQVDHVSADNLGIGNLACEYLAGKGCKNLAYISNEPDWLIMRLRGFAFARAAGDSSLTCTSYIVDGSPKAVEAYGRNANVSPTLEKAVDRLAAANPKHDGLFIPTDLLTTRVYPLLAQRGVEPERDIRIVSCDNEEERLGMLATRPASIDIRGEEIGRWAVRQLVQRLQRPDDPCTRMQVAPRLVLPGLHP
jgi:DNA-binding LacI/PurR family transcriptional regulator